MMPLIMVDRGKCTGCRLCEIACHVRHHASGVTAGCLEGPMLPRLHKKTGESQFFSQCRQCENPPCIKACKKSALIMGKDRILLEPSLCKSCDDCVKACPLGGVRLVPQDTVTNRAGFRYGDKCTLCMGADQEDIPACVRHCPSQALQLVQPQRWRKEKAWEAARMQAGIADRRHK